MPNISPADKVSLYSITPIKVAATGSTDAKIEAFPLSKFLSFCYKTAKRETICTLW